MKERMMNYTSCLDVLGLPTLIVFLFLLFPSCAAFSQSKYTVSTSVLNVRADSSVNSPVVGTFSMYDTVVVSSVSDEWGRISYLGDSCFISMQYLKPVTDNSLYEMLFGSCPSNVITMALLLVLFLYIFCVIQVHNDKMVVIKGWLDLILLIIPWILVAIMLPSLSFNEESVIMSYKALYIAITAVAALMLVVSLIKTIVANISSPVLMILAVLMKLVIIPLIPLGILYIGFKDRSTRKGKLESLKLLLVAGLLIGALMSFDD